VFSNREHHHVRIVGIDRALPPEARSGALANAFRIWYSITRAANWKDMAAIRSVFTLLEVDREPEVTFMLRQGELQIVTLLEFATGVLVIRRIEISA